MSERFDDGSAGDANYGAIGRDYSRYRRPDPSVASLIKNALWPARTILNVGAGAGSYEPIDLQVTAVEPSASMRAQRPAHLPPAIMGVAEKLPFADGSFDAGMATFTVHQWQDLTQGLKEMRRVIHGPIVILTCDPDELGKSWLNDYAPEMIAVEAKRYPSLTTLAAALGDNVVVNPVPIPLRCSDGFGEAYYGRPEALLDPGARLACSAWSFVPAAVAERFVRDLSRDLASGAWDARYGHLRTQPSFHGSLKLIIGRGEDSPSPAV
ncbi:class I SAM-dependent methyltransferase [Acerihabitans sp. KWT182]|uniref:Class I SAM-dependent methyltransferase n=1 Tax=Acerihabitans sp. KWT182 TaxID=3157919 RepID=A0AAU7QBF4_9GAMM